jgi:hypothetical protein
MFKLVGKETFFVGAAKTKATINIDAISGFAYEYTLEIDGKSLKKYMENRSKTTSTWVLRLDGEDLRVVLGKSGLSLQSLPAIVISCSPDFCGHFPRLEKGSSFSPLGFTCGILMSGLIRLDLKVIILGLRSNIYPGIDCLLFLFINKKAVRNLRTLERTRLFCR